MIEISKICIDGRLQSRAALDQNVVADYAEAYRAAVKMPPVVLFFDGSTYWLADGFHRYNGAKDAGLAQIHEEIIPGTLREAILYSVRANEAHGLRRTNADKRKAVQTLLDDAEWAAWSSNAIAKACGVGDHLVADIRKSYLRENEDAPIIRKVERDGVAYEQNTAKIGKKKAESLPPNSDRDESCDTAQPDNGAPFSAEQKENGGLNSGGRPSKETPRDAREVKPTTLKGAGISHDLSSRAQKLAAVPDAEFEQEVGEWRERVSSENARVTTRLEAAGAREQKKSKPKHDFRSAEEKALAEDLPMQIEMLTDAVAALVEENEAMKNQVAALVFDGSAEERAEYLARLNELIADNKRLTLLNKALTDARDTAMAESNALRGQIRYMKKQAEKS